MDQTLPTASRFVTNFNAEAVLDRETGLGLGTIAAHPGVHVELEATGSLRLQRRHDGRSWGWLLPATHELLSLLDPSLPVVAGQARLPTGHPFSVTGAVTVTGNSFSYWAATTINFNNLSAGFYPSVDMSFGVQGGSDGAQPGAVWCVRGPGGVPSVF